MSKNKNVGSDPNDDGNDACTVVSGLDARPKVCDYSPPKKPDPWGGWNKGKTSEENEQEIDPKNYFFMYNSTLERTPNPISLTLHPVDPSSRYTTR